MSGGSLSGRSSAFSRRGLSRSSPQVQQPGHEDEDSCVAQSVDRDALVRRKSFEVTACGLDDEDDEEEEEEELIHY